MPANIVAIIYIHLALSFGVVCSFLVYKKQDVFYCAFIWSFINIIAFLSRSFWILFFSLFLFSLFLFLFHRRHAIYYYFMALPILPLNISYNIPSPFYDTRYLLTVTYYTLLSLFIFSPLFFQLVSNWYFSKIGTFKKIRFLESPTDQLILAYSFILFVLAFRDEPSLTSALKNIIHFSLLITIPYYVISRLVNSIEDLQKILTAIFWTAVFLSLISLIQISVDWDIYNILHSLLKMDVGRLYYGKQYRFGLLRVEGTMGGPIPLGYFITLSIGILFFLVKQNRSKIIPSFLSVVLFFAVLFLTGSRACWLSGFMLIVLMHGLSKVDFDHIGIYLASGFFLFLGILLASWKAALALDPFGTFIYRIDLFQNSFTVIRNHLWLGSANFLETPEMEAMRQGQKIIDIVNTYLQVALHSGIIGLSIFIAVFIMLIFQISGVMKRLSLKENQVSFNLGLFLLSALMTTVVFIGTVSSISYIPVYYWSLIGLSSAYVRMMKNNDSSVK